MGTYEENSVNFSSSLSRRDALKQLGLLGGAPLLFTAPVESSGSKLDIKAKIVIVGGGAAGITVAARLTRELDNPDITIIEPSERHVYQAGHTLVAGGIVEPEKLVVKTQDYIPDGVKWLKIKSNNIDPDLQEVSLENGQQLKYDYLVVAPGLQYDWGLIEGLDSSMIGKDGINSIYTLDGALNTWSDIQKFAKDGGKALFTHPNTPIKCGGAPKKILYLMDDYLRQQNSRDKAEITYFTNSSKLFSVPVFEKAIKSHWDERDINYNFQHNLVKIDPKNKKATFETQIKKQGAWDEDLEEYEEIFEKKLITKDYDFIHIPPPMSAPDFLKGSKLAWDKGQNKKLGLINVDRYTLQHAQYKNVFSLGDVIGTPYGRTGGTVRKQAPIVVQNMLDVMQGKEPTQKFNGYTVCPIITRYGKVMLAEFDYNGNPVPTIPGIAVEEERWIWWIMKVYILEPMYFHGMLRGLA